MGDGEAAFSGVVGVSTDISSLVVVLSTSTSTKLLASDFDVSSITSFCKDPPAEKCVKRYRMTCLKMTINKYEEEARLRQA